MPSTRRVLRPALAGAAFALLLGCLPLDAALGRSPERSVASYRLQGRAPVPAGRAVDPLDCGDGFTQTTVIRGTGLEEVLVIGSRAWAVGGERETDTTRRPLFLTLTSSGWRPAAVPTLGDDDGLVAVDGTGPRDIWTVGFTTADGLLRPNALRWDGRKWTPRRPRPPERSGSALTDVVMTGDGRPWAVGFAVRAGGGERPVVLRFTGSGWQHLDPPMGRASSMTLTAIDTTRSGGVWVVGHAGQGRRIVPLVMRRADGRWNRMRLPDVPGEGVLTDVASASPTEAWAVGYQTLAGRTVPLALRWDGRAWRRVPAPEVASEHALLLGVDLPLSGGVWAVGSSWDSEASSYRSLAAWWDGQAWIPVPSTDGGTELHAVAGAPDLDGWVVGRSGRGGVLSRVCPSPQVGLFGGSEPVDVSAEPWLDDTDPEARVHRTGRAPRPRTDRLRRVEALPRARPHAALVVRDVAGTVGLAERALTYGGVVADFDGDGRDDVYIGRHFAPGRLVLNEGGRFAEHAPFVQPRADRHGCAASDVDGSGLPDLVCTIGAMRGTGLKANELWLDPGGPAPREVGGTAGLVDPSGRGRDTVFLRNRADGPADIVLANAPSRVDGLPSPSRLLIADGTGRFRQRERSGFDPRLGSWAIEAADLDGDGRDELLMVAHDEQSPGTNGIRLYRNTPAGLVEATVRLGVRPIGERDAHFADLNGDGRMDLVQLAPTRLRVSLWRGGRFVPAYERALTDGRAVATGDADGNGLADIYLVRGSSRGNPQDILLLNIRRGAGYRALAVPRARGGDADDALAIDHDRNGLTDFVVLNGRARRGPVQLIAFYRPSTALRGR